MTPIIIIICVFICVAAMVGALTQHPVATAALAPSHSPGPVFTGPVVSHAVDWLALADPEDGELGPLPDPDRSATGFGV